MDPPATSQRTIRAPATIVRPSKLNAYSGYIAQNKFRIINPTGSNTITRPSQNLQPTRPISPIPMLAAPTSTTVTTSSTNRLPIRPSGLVRPTPVKQIISAPTSTTTLLKQPQTSRLPSSALPSSSKLATLRPSAIKSTTVEKPRALIRAKFSPSQNPSLVTESITTKATTTSTTTLSQITNGNDISSIEHDVGQIRRLLEQLLTLLQASHADQESMAQENERLRREVADLKGKIRAIRSTVAANRDSEVIPAGDSQAFTATAATKDESSRPRSSVYLSPLN